MAPHSFPPVPQMQMGMNQMHMGMGMNQMGNNQG